MHAAMQGKVSQSVSANENLNDLFNQQYPNYKVAVSKGSWSLGVGPGFICFKGFPGKVKRKPIEVLLKDLPLKAVWKPFSGLDNTLAKSLKVIFCKWRAMKYIDCRYQGQNFLIEDWGRVKKMSLL